MIDVTQQNSAPRQRRIADAFLKALSSFPLAKVASSRDPIVLLYHGVPRVSSNGEVHARVLEDHVRFLTSRFEVVRLEHGAPRKRLEKQRVVLTFDDGFRNNAEVAAPILQRYKVPAVFFVCSRHTEEKTFLWVSYIDALARFYRWPDLRFKGERFDMRPAMRMDSVERIRSALRDEFPHPTGAYMAIREELPELKDFVSDECFTDRYAGMTTEQIGELGANPLFTIGSHTADHPFLEDCTDDEMTAQIASNMGFIESATGKKCRTIAYPSGSYDQRVLEVCERLDLASGYAVTPKVGRNPRLEIPRLGVYNPSQAILGFKVQWGNHLRAARIAVG